MNDEIQLAFKELEETFKLLSTNEKKVEIINSLKEVITLIDALAKREGKELNFLKSKEIDDLESEDDFLESLLVYVENIKNLLGLYLIDKI